MTTTALCVLLVAGCGDASASGPDGPSADEVTIDGVGTVPLVAARCEQDPTPTDDPEAGAAAADVDLDVVVTAEGQLEGEPLLVELSRFEAAGMVVEEARVTLGDRAAPTRGWEAVAATSSDSGEPVEVPLGGGEVTLTLTTSEDDARASGVFAVIADGELTDDTAEVEVTILCAG